MRDKITDVLIGMSAAYEAAFRELTEKFKEVKEHMVEYQETTLPNGKKSVRAYAANFGYSSSYEFPA